jgi:hypothetical protein
MSAVPTLSKLRRRALQSARRPIYGFWNESALAAIGLPRLGGASVSSQITRSVICVDMREQTLPTVAQNIRRASERLFENARHAFTYSSFNA